MSPEQLEGKQVEFHRTDIFSLGVILYEMATGQRPFRGESTASLIASILSSDPVPIRSLQPSISPALERVIVTALDKSPDERWQTAQDVGRQLRWISESSHTAEQAAPARNRRAPIAAVIVISAVAAGLLLWGGARFRSNATARPGKVSLQFALPAGIEASRSPEQNDFVISPDGRTIAFVARSGGVNSLFIRELGAFGVKKVEGTDGAIGPFWSSDGESLGFSAGGKLWKTKVAGGATPEAICDIAPYGTRASWSGDTILFGDARGDRKELYRVPAAGGTPVKVTSLRPGEWRHNWPVLLPDGEHYVYESFAAGSPDRTLLLASLSSPKQSVIARNVSFARMLGKDRIVYVRDGSLLSQRIDLAKGTVASEQETIATDVGYFYITGRADFDASPTGTVVYRTETSTSRLMMMDRKGTVTKTFDDNGLFYDHTLSPDGRKAAVTIETRATGLMDIWIYDLARGVRDRFTNDPGMEVSPAWSPDGRSIVYSQGEGGVFPHLVRRSLTGSTAEDLTMKGSFQFSASFSRDGENIYYEDDPGGGYDILRFSLKTKISTPVVKTSFYERSPAVSPDGAWLAYVSTATGRSEVYIQNLTGGETVRSRISDNGGREPEWRADGKELFFVGPDGTVMSVVPSSAGHWDDATLRALFRVSDDVYGCVPTPDGQSFLVSTRKDGAADSLFHVVLGLE